MAVTETWAHLVRSSAPPKSSTLSHTERPVTKSLFIQHCVRWADMNGSPYTIPHDFATIIDSIYNILIVKFTLCCRLRENESGERRDAAQDASNVCRLPGVPESRNVHAIPADNGQSTDGRQRSVHHRESRILPSRPAAARLARQLAPLAAHLQRATLPRPQVAQVEQQQQQQQRRDDDQHGGP